MGDFFLKAKSLLYRIVTTDVTNTVAPNAPMTAPQILSETKKQVVFKRMLGAVPLFLTPAAC